MENIQSSSAEASADKQTKPDHKVKAIVSFVLGIISVIPFFIFILYWFFPISFIFSFPYMGSTSFIAGLVGLILGIIGLKSSKKKIAIAGIILCIIGVLYVFIIIGLAMLGFGGIGR